MSLITIQNENLTVTVSTKGAELQSVVGKNGTEFIWEGDPNVWEDKAPVLFPICGSLKEEKYVFDGKEYSLPQHGFASSVEYEVEEKTQDSVTFLYTANEETRKCYPFDFTFRIIFGISGNKLNVDYKVENTGAKEMYFSAGAHEGYACPEGYEAYSVVFDEPETLYHTVLEGPLVTNEKICILENEKELPLKKQYFEIDAIVIEALKSRKISLVKRGASKKITLEFPGHDHLLIWTMPEGKYICFEPWTGLPDRVGSGYLLSEKESITCLPAGKQTIISHAITFEE